MRRTPGGIAAARPEVATVRRDSPPWQSPPSPPGEIVSAQYKRERTQMPYSFQIVQPAAD
jgi:hypothetical protein